MNNPKFNYNKELRELEENFVDPDLYPILPLDDDMPLDDDLYGDTAPGDFEDWPVADLEGDGID